MLRRILLLCTACVVLSACDEDKIEIRSTTIEGTLVRTTDESFNVSSAAGGFLLGSSMGTSYAVIGATAGGMIGAEGCMAHVRVGEKTIRVKKESSFCTHAATGQSISVTRTERVRVSDGMILHVSYQ